MSSVKSPAGDGRASDIVRHLLNLCPHLAIMGIEVNPPMVAGGKDENLNPE